MLLYVLRSFMYLCNVCYIPSCDIVAHVFLSGLVGRAQVCRAEGSGFESGSGKKKKKRVGLFLSSFTIVY